MPDPRTTLGVGAGRTALNKAGATGTRRRIKPSPPSVFGDGAERHLRVAWYRRASTDEGNQPYTLEAQEARLGAYSAGHPNWEFVA